jgi:hypothetical protein
MPMLTDQQGELLASLVWGTPEFAATVAELKRQGVKTGTPGASRVVDGEEVQIRPECLSRRIEIFQLNDKWHVWDSEECVTIGKCRYRDGAINFFKHTMPAKFR